MPEFILDMGSPEGAKSFAQLDDFTQAYITAAFFTETGTGDDAERGLEHASVDEISHESLAKIIADCASWQQAHAVLLAQAYERSGYDPSQAGHDYWLTRNGHGAGYWDRHPLDADGLGAALTAACQYREVTVYRGDDDFIYFD